MDNNNFSISGTAADSGDINLIKFFVVCSFVILLLAVGVLNLFILYEVLNNILKQKNSKKSK